MNSAKAFRASQENWKKALIKRAQSTIQDGEKIRALQERMAKLKKEDQDKGE